MSSFFICTFGCRLNQADSDEIRAQLARRYDRETETPGEADLIVINSCTVTRRADQQVRQTVRRLRRENPEAKLVVTGCYAERDPRKIAAIPGVDLVAGNAAKPRLSGLLKDNGRSRIVHPPLDTRICDFDASRCLTGSKTRPNVKLQDGCDARCSYCIVPTVRGRGRSVAADAAVERVRNLTRQGYREIVLTGIDLGSYGRRLEKRVSLAELLRRILEVPGLGRLRLSSIEPMRFDREIVRLAEEYRCFARHFHVPLQSGSDRILRLMRRPYRVERLQNLLRYIRERLPDAGIGADVIVGFPGETEEDFQRTCKLVSRSPLTYLHVFPFSAREGTEAFSMTERIDPKVIRDRARILREISRNKNLAFRRSFLGRNLPAISLAKEEGMGEAVVLTDNYVHARVDGPLSPNRLLEVRIDRVRAEGTWASVQSEAAAVPACG